jgi:hypothetical protein
MTEIQISEEQIKANMLVYMANMHVGIREQGGNNQGQMVKRFQRAVDGKAHGEPWCMSFVQYLMMTVDDMYDALMMHTSQHKRQIHSSEHVLSCWNKTPKEQRIFKPEAGCLILWSHWRNEKETSSGHVGIISRPDMGGMVETVEGNTGSDDAEIVREGDGVFLKNRNTNYHYGSMRLKGFLKVW